MPNIYDQHRAAFSRVSAYVILWEGTVAATVAFKFPRDGAGRLYAYVHWLGEEMVRGSATGGGYDKRSASVRQAVARMQRTSWPGHADFLEALAKDNGHAWDDQLREAGFTAAYAV